MERCNFHPLACSPLLHNLLCSIDLVGFICNTLSHPGCFCPLFFWNTLNNQAWQWPPPVLCYVHFLQNRRTQHVLAPPVNFFLLSLLVMFGSIVRRMPLFFVLCPLKFFLQFFIYLLCITVNTVLVHVLVLILSPAALCTLGQLCLCFHPLVPCLVYYEQWVVYSLQCLQLFLQILLYTVCTVHAFILTHGGLGWGGVTITGIET